MKNMDRHGDISEALETWRKNGGGQPFDEWLVDEPEQADDDAASETMERICVGFESFCDDNDCHVCRYSCMKTRADCAIAFAIGALRGKHEDVTGRLSARL